MSRCASSGCFPRGWEGRRGCQPLGRGCSCSWVSPRQAPATFRRCDSRACCLKHPLPARRSSPEVRICTSTMHVPKEILELKGQDEKVQQDFYLEDIQAFHPYPVQADQLRSVAPGGNKAPLALLVPPRLASLQTSPWGMLTAVPALGSLEECARALLYRINGEGHPGSPSLCYKAQKVCATDKISAAMSAYGVSVPCPSRGSRQTPRATTATGRATKRRQPWPDVH